MVDKASEVKKELTPDDLVQSVPATSSLEGNKSVSTEDVKTSPKSNETSDKSVLNFNENGVSIIKDEVHEEQSTSQAARTNLVM